MLNVAVLSVAIYLLCAECSDLFIVMLNVVMPSVVMLSVVAPLNVTISINYSQCNIKLCQKFYCYAGYLYAPCFILFIAMLSVVIPGVVVLIVVAPASWLSPLFMIIIELGCQLWSRSGAYTLKLFIRKVCFQFKSKFITDDWFPKHMNITILN
jgi:hypothetical protein